MTFAQRRRGAAGPRQSLSATQRPTLLEAMGPGPEIRACKGRPAQICGLARCPGAACLVSGWSSAMRRRGSRLRSQAFAAPPGSGGAGAGATIRLTVLRSFPLPPYRAAAGAGGAAGRRRRPGRSGASKPAPIRPPADAGRAVRRLARRRRPCNRPFRPGGMAEPSGRAISVGKGAGLSVRADRSAEMQGKSRAGHRIAEQARGLNTPCLRRAAG